MNASLQAVKEDPRLPDNYEIKITYHDKSEDVFKAISHAYKSEMDMIEIYTASALFEVIPMNAIRKMSFDKNFTNLQELIAAKKEKK